MPSSVRGETGEDVFSGDPTRQRLPLDVLVERANDPAFASRHRRPLSFRETSRHVNPLMLASCRPGSLYVRSWRGHAEECATCARLFVYFGLDGDTGT
jgi:hypothetical protein